LAEPVPLSDSIYAWIFGIAAAASIPFILLIKQCSTELRNEIKRNIALVAKKPHDDDFYLEMFHISRNYHSWNSQIKYACASFLAILISSALGLAYDRRWALLDEFYMNATLVISGAFFVVLVRPLAWRFIKCHWQ